MQLILEVSVGSVAAGECGHEEYGSGTHWGEENDDSPGGLGWRRWRGEVFERETGRTDTLKDCVVYEYKYTVYIWIATIYK